MPNKITMHLSSPLSFTKIFEFKNNYSLIIQSLWDIRRVINSQFTQI